MQNFRFIGAMVSEFRFFKEEEEEEEDEDEEHGKFGKIMFTCISDLIRYFHPFFCMLLLFHMFSTFMSLEIRLN